MERVGKGGGAVVTGAEASDADATAEPTLLWGDKPVIVYVCDEAVGCEGFDKLEEVVFKYEKLALGMKAFRTVKMHPDLVDADPLLKGAGKDVPRMLLIDPLKLKVTVLEKGRLKASSLYSAMKKIAGKFYKEKLDKVVKSHLKLLTEQDQLANAQKVLSSKIARLKGEDGKAALKDLEKAEGEQAEVAEELSGIQAKQRELWKLTPKHEPA